MKYKRSVAKWIVFTLLIIPFVCGCVENEVPPTISEPVSETTNTFAPTAQKEPSPSSASLPTEPAIPSPSPTVAPPVASPSNAPTQVEATLLPSPASVESTLPPGAPSSGIWISSHDRVGSEAWIQFEVYYQDGEPLIDVLEACVSYSCDIFGDLFEAEGCSHTQSPGRIPIKNGKIRIDFGDIMPEVVTHNSKLGIIDAVVTSPDEITGSWILPACDLWLNLELDHLTITPTP